MSDFQWQFTTTWTRRYKEDGVTKCVEDYISKIGRRDLDVLDVGCSTGIALRTMQEDIQSKYGITLRTTGIEPNSSVQQRAEKNVDNLYKDRIQNITVPSKRFDIVICNKVAYLARPDDQSNMISYCAKFLKTEGGLVTDLGCYRTLHAAPKCSLYVGSTTALEHSENIKDSWEKLPSWRRIASKAAKRFAVQVCAYSMVLPFQK